MVVIKPKRDFTSQDRVSYAASNASKIRLGTASNVHREEIGLGQLLERNGLPASSVHQYKENLCSAMGIGLSLIHISEPTRPY